MAKIIEKSDFFFILQHVLEAVLGKMGMLSITMLYLRKKSQSKMVIPNDFFGKRRLRGQGGGLGQKIQVRLIL